MAEAGSKQISQTHCLMATGSSANRVTPPLPVDEPRGPGDELQDPPGVLPALHPGPNMGCSCSSYGREYQLPVVSRRFDMGIEADDPLPLRWQLRVQTGFQPFGRIPLAYFDTWMGET